MSPDSNPTTTPTSRRFGVWAWTLLALVPVVIFGVLIWHQRWMSDDGFINVTVVRNLLHGHGPVFNVGERVETYTSTLWVGLLALLGAVGVRVEYAAVGMGLLFSMAGLFAATLGAATLHRWDTRAGVSVFAGCAPLGALIYMALPPAWDYGTSGLETGLALGWMGVSFLLLTRLAIDETGDDAGQRPAWHPYALAFLLGLGPLIRPELALMSFTLLAPLLMVVFRRQNGGFSFKRLVLLGVAMGAVPVAYQIFRMGYFAALVPNTALAKEAFRSRWKQGGYFFWNFFGLYKALLPLGLIGVIWVAELVRAAGKQNYLRVVLTAAPTLCGLFYILYVVKIGGGFMHGRLFLPAVFATVMPLASVPIVAPRGSLARRWWRLAVGLPVVAWAAYCAIHIRVPRENSHGIGDERGWYVRSAHVDHPIAIEDYAKMHFAVDARRLRAVGERSCPSVFDGGKAADHADKPCKRIVYARLVQATGFGRLFPARQTFPLRERYAKQGIALVVMRTAMGMRGMVLGPHTHVVDHAGLASPLASRLILEHRGRPGHEKALPTVWMVARFAKPALGEDPRVSAARHALKCGGLADLLDAVEGPITASRFLSNLSEAFRLHELRFPSNPFEAEQRLCGVAAPHAAIRGGPGGRRRSWRCPAGYALSGMWTRLSPKAHALASLEPRCRKLDERDGRLVTTGAPSAAPRFGGKSHARRQTLDCPDGGVVVGLRGGTKRWIRRLTPVCASLDKTGARASDAAHPAGTTGSGGEPFDLTCPDGTVATGVVTRSGALVDAAGLLCSQPARSSSP